MLAFVIVPIAPAVAIVFTASPPLVHCTALTYCGTRSSTRSGTDYRPVPAANLMTDGCTSGPTYGSSQNRILPLVEIGATTTECCEAEC